jgi:hypothetical protein
MKGLSPLLIAPHGDVLNQLTRDWEQNGVIPRVSHINDALLYLFDLAATVQYRVKNSVNTDGDKAFYSMPCMKGLSPLLSAASGICSKSAHLRERLRLGVRRHVPRSALALNANWG